VIAVELAEVYLTHAHCLDRPRRRRMWLRRCSVTAPPPPPDTVAQDMDLAVVDAHAVAVRHWAERDSINGYVSVFDCRVGSVEVECEIEHDVARPPTSRPSAVAPGCYRTVDEVLGVGAGYYATGHRFRSQRISNLEGDVRDRYLQALVRVSPTSTAALSDDGLGGHYEPALSMVDCMLSLTQFGRAAVARLLGAEWARSAAVLLTAIAMETKTPYQPMLNSFAVSLAATDGARPGCSVGDWRTFELSGQFQGIHARATVAYASTETPPAVDWTQERPDRAHGCPPDRRVLAAGRAV
jgi:hypothetical protein